VSVHVQIAKRDVPSSPIVQVGLFTDQKAGLSVSAFALYTASSHDWTPHRLGRCFRCAAWVDGNTRLYSSLSPNAITTSTKSSITALAARFMRSKAGTSFGFSKLCASENLSG
jgi:hypothetical protein